MNRVDNEEGQMADDKERPLPLFEHYVGRWTEEGQVIRIDGELVLRAGGKPDVPLVMFGRPHLWDLLSQLGHSGFFP